MKHNLQFKCFCKGSYENAKYFTMEDVEKNPTSIPHFDVAIPLVGFQDSNNIDVYAGDVLCLPITDKLMETSFSNSNLGKYIEKHPGITEVYLVTNDPSGERPWLFYYEVYMAYDHKIERHKDCSVDDPDYNKPVVNCYSDDTLFPRYLVAKGATIVGNMYVEPEFLTTH